MICDICKKECSCKSFLTGACDECSKKRTIRNKIKKDISKLNEIAKEVLK